MDVFDAADFADLLPRRWLRRVAVAVLAVAFLFPTTFQDWYLAQARHHAQHIVDQLMPTTSTQPPAEPSRV